MTDRLAEEATPRRPGWVPTELYPFEDRYEKVEGALVH